MGDNGFAVCAKPNGTGVPRHRNTNDWNELLENEKVSDHLIEAPIANGVGLENEGGFMSLLNDVQGVTSAQKGPRDLNALVVEAMGGLGPNSNDQDSFDRAVVHVVDADVESVVPEPVHSTHKVRDDIALKLRLNSSDSSDHNRLDALIDRLKEAGIPQPHVYLSIREAVNKAQISERTVRRYISDGALITEKVKGTRGWEHRVYAPALFLLLDERSGVFEKARSSPMEDMGREIASLCRVIVEQQSIADRRTDKLLEEIQRQSRTIDELRAEQRDARAQMHNLQEQMIRALMPRKKPSIWERLFDSTSN